MNKNKNPYSKVKTAEIFPTREYHFNFIILNYIQNSFLNKNRKLNKRIL